MVKNLCADMPYFAGLVTYSVEVFEAVLHELFERNDITKLSTVEQHYNYHCSVMFTHS